jgi:hypothetical protein
MSRPYGLYQTLVTGEGRITASEKKILLSSIDRLDKQQREAFFMLICEHARLHNNFKFDGLPYNLEQRSTDISFDLKDLPIKLQRVLYNFIKNLA